MKKGFRLLREVDEASRFFFMPDDEIAYDPTPSRRCSRSTTARACKCCAI